MKIEKEKFFLTNITKIPKVNFMLLINRLIFVFLNVLKMRAT